MASNFHSGFFSEPKIVSHFIELLPGWIARQLLPALSYEPAKWTADFPEKFSFHLSFVRLLRNKIWPMKALHTFCTPFKNKSTSFFSLFRKVAAVCNSLYMLAVFTNSNVVCRQKIILQEQILDCFFLKGVYPLHHSHSSIAWYPFSTWWIVGEDLVMYVGGNSNSVAYIVICVCANNVRLP